MNAKDNTVIDRFIELRAQGWTFARIAAELDVSKPTLIAWSRKHQHRIRNLRALETESLADQCQVSRRACLEHLGEDIRRLRAELTQRDLATIPTARLVVLLARLRLEANRFNGPPHLAKSAASLPANETEQCLDPCVDWEG